MYSASRSITGLVVISHIVSMPSLRRFCVMKHAAIYGNKRTAIVLRRSGMTYQREKRR